MKRLKRNPERFEPIELFSALAQVHDYDLKNSEHEDDFIHRVRTSLNASRQNPVMLNGKRTENLFKHVCAALNHCTFLKQEDAGEMMSTEPELQAPDYRIVLRDRRHIFVEVKNFNADDLRESFRMTKAYSDKVENYGKLQGIPVYYAIYIRLLRSWVLVSRSSMKEEEKEYSLTPASAIAKNEMYLLGDLIIGTEPDLVFELHPDRTKDVSVNEENFANFTIGAIKIYSNNREVTDTFEMNTAFYLMRFGEWDCSEPTGIVDNGELNCIRFTFSPRDYDNYHKQGFDFIGTLSSMVSTAFNEHTVYDSQVKSLDTVQSARLFTINIPHDYKGEALPLIQVSPRPNFAFTEQ